jgi:malic enzyme
VRALVEGGLPTDEARRRVWFVDGTGLVVRSRTDLAAHKRPFAHDHPPLDFLEALHSLRPDVLIGATGQPGTFTEETIRAMAILNDQPVIFALSNPTSRALASQTSDVDLAAGTVYPPLRRIRAVSLAIAAAVAETAYEEGVAALPRPASLERHLAGLMYDPTY